MKSAIKRTVLHYYVALQLSAGALAPLGVPLSDDGPAPIVRRYQVESGWQFDPREVISVGRQTAILTLPDHAKTRPSGDRFLPN